jgi:WD40 repeat protein
MSAAKCQGLRRPWRELSLAGALAILAWCAAPGGLGSNAAAQNQTSPDPVTLESLHQELKELKAAVDEQNRKINRLYSAVEPELAEMEQRAEDWRMEHEADTRLKLVQVCTVSDVARNSSAQFSPAEDLFAAISNGGTIVLYDLTAKPLRELRRAGETCSSLAFAPDGKRLLAGMTSGKILLWNLADGSCTIAFEQPAKVARVGWLAHPDRGLCFIEPSSYDQQKYVEEKKARPSAFVFDLATSKPLVPIHSMARCDYQSFSGSADGKYLAMLELVGKERAGFVLDAADGRPMATLFNQDYSSGPLSVAFAPDNHTVALGYAPYHLSLWDGPAGKQVRFIKGHSNWVVALAFSPDSRQLISGSGDCTARIWNVATGDELGRIRFDGNSTYVKSVGFSRDGKLVLAAAESGQVLVCKTPPLAPAP